MVVQVGITVGGNKKEFVGLTADTATFISTQTGCGPGSTYLELDGDKRLYMFNGTTWYEL